MLTDEERVQVLAALFAGLIDNDLLKEFYTMDHQHDQPRDGSSLFFLDDEIGDWTPPLPNQRYNVGQRCPECGNMMELKTNTRTNHKFVGCTNYPRCSVAGKTKD